MDVVKRYEPDEVLYRDRYYKASMLSASDGEWVEYEDYHTLEVKLTAAMILRHQGWEIAERLEVECEALRAKVNKLQRQTATKACPPRLTEEMIKVGKEAVDCAMAYGCASIYSLAYVYAEAAIDKAQDDTYDLFYQLRRAVEVAEEMGSESVNISVLKSLLDKTRT